MGAFAASNLLRDACETPSLADLRRFIRFHIDGLQEGPGGDLIPDPEWPDEVIDMAVNEAYANLAQEQVMSFEGNFLVEQDFPVPDGSREIDLPDTLFKVDWVALKVANDWYPCEYDAGGDEPEYGTPSQLWFAVPRYRFQGARKLILNPPMAGDATIRIRWYTLPGCVRGPNDRLDENFLKVWHWLVVLDAAIICKAKDDGDSSQLERIRDKHYMTFRMAVEQRSAGPRFIDAFWPEGYGA